MIKNALIAGLTVILVVLIGFVVLNSNGFGTSDNASDSHPMKQASVQERESSFVDAVREHGESWLTINNSDDELVSLGYESCNALDAYKREGNYSAEAVVEGIIQLDDTPQEVKDAMLMITVFSANTLCPEHSSLNVTGD